MGGPHRGRELELLLAGLKPMARFTAEPGYRPDCSAFDKHVACGAVEHAVIVDGPVERIYYYLPGEAWRVRLAEAACRYDLGLSAEDLHRLDGFLFGYSKEDVEAFIATWLATEREGGPQEL